MIRVRPVTNGASATDDPRWVGRTIRPPIGWVDWVERTQTGYTVGHTLVPDERWRPSFLQGMAEILWLLRGQPARAKFEAAEARKVVPFDVPFIPYSGYEKPTEGNEVEFEPWPEYLSAVRAVGQLLSGIVKTQAHPVEEACRYEVDTFAGSPSFKSDPAAHGFADAIVALTSPHETNEVMNTILVAQGDEPVADAACTLWRIQEMSAAKPQDAYSWGSGVMTVEAQVYGAARTRPIKAVSHHDNEPERAMSYVTLRALKELVPGTNHGDLSTRETRLWFIAEHGSWAADISKFDANTSMAHMERQLEWWRYHPEYGGAQAYYTACRVIRAPSLGASPISFGSANIRQDPGLKSGSIFTTITSNLTITIALAVALGITERTPEAEAKERFRTAPIAYYGDNIVAAPTLAVKLGAVLARMQYTLEWEEGRELLRSWDGALYAARAIGRSIVWERQKRRGAVELGTGVRLLGLARHPGRDIALRVVNEIRGMGGHEVLPSAEAYFQRGVELLGSSAGEELSDYRSVIGDGSVFNGVAVTSRRGRVVFDDAYQFIRWSAPRIGLDMAKWPKSLTAMLRRRSRVTPMHGNSGRATIARRGDVITR